MTYFIAESNAEQRTRAKLHKYSRSLSAGMAGVCYYQSRPVAEDNNVNQQMNNNNSFVLGRHHDLDNLVRAEEDGVRLNLKMYQKFGAVCENLLRGREAEYLDLACRRGDQKLMGIIEKYLMKHVTPNNCVNTFQVAVTYGLCELKGVAIRAIGGHFDQLFDCPSVQYLGQKVIEELLESPMIRCHPLAPRALEHWYNYEKEPRQAYYRKIRQFLRVYEDKFTPPVSPANNDIVYNAFFHGNEVNHTMNVTVLNINSQFQKTVPLREVSEADEGFAVCCQQSVAEDPPYVFISGGNLAPKTVYTCDVVQGSRRKCSGKLLNARSHHCMHSVQQRVFVLGGVHLDRAVDAIEEKKIHRGLRICHAWKEVAKLLVPVYKAASCVYEDNIFIFGGLDNCGNARKSVQKFDPVSTLVTLDCELPFAIHGSRAVVFNKEVYIATRNLNTIVYNPENKQIRLLDPVPIAGAEFQMFTDGQEVYVAGTCGGTQGALQTYVLGRQSNRWHRTTAGLAQGLGSSGCCQILIPAKYQGMVPFLS